MRVAPVTAHMAPERRVRAPENRSFVTLKSIVGTRLGKGAISLPIRLEQLLESRLPWPMKLIR